MRLCLVTDRHRFKPPVDEREGLLAQARQAVGAGVDIIHIRERDLEAAELASLVTAILAIARGSSTRVVVNDRLDVAIACGADGVHLRADSMRVDDARRLAPAPFLVGRSVHTVHETSASAGADYLVAGTVFRSTSKPDAAAWLGAQGLQAIVRAAAPLPVLAIGGVTLDRIAEIALTGAAGAAAIGLFLGPWLPGADSSLADVVGEARRRFDSVKPAP